MAAAITFELRNRGDKTTLWADGSPLEPSGLHGHDVDPYVSIVAAHRPVRMILVATQQRLAEGHPIVMLGRDIGTVVLPNVPVKIYLTATADVRTDRRRRERAARGSTADQESLLREMGARDRLDETREVSPLRPADDAFIVDTSDMTIPQTVKYVMREKVKPELESLRA